MEYIKADSVRLQTAREDVDYLKTHANGAHAAYENIRKYVNNVFYEIGEAEVDCFRLYDENYRWK